MEGGHSLTCWRPIEHRGVEAASQPVAGPPFQLFSGISAAAEQHEEAHPGQQGRANSFRHCDGISKHDKLDAWQRLLVMHRWFLRHRARAAAQAAGNDDDVEAVHEKNELYLIIA